MNYERIVQWAAGPVSALVGLGSTALVHQNISHQASLSIATYVLSTAATYLAHHKWLDNVPKWWTATQASLPAGVGVAVDTLSHDALSVADNFVKQGVDAINAEEAKAQEEQAKAGTHPEQVTAGLSPDPVGTPGLSPTPPGTVA